MDGDRHQRVKTVFMEALRLEPSQRGHFLRESCTGDSELRSEVEALLSFHETGTGILDESLEYGTFDLPEMPVRTHEESGQALVGSEIGPYHLQEFLGQGGMGLVFLAEQRQPVQRKVALKIVKSNRETAEILARFEAERQVLALMDHPCIARIHETGATSDGRPFFTMEFVQGVPLNDFCDRNRLTIRQRLALFALVCDGIQHAHQKGIIHRDLKPSNILVAGTSEKPRPKIIDFGVAKALYQFPAGASPVTEHGLLVGTPGYMSPEQAESAGQDVDTRSDIYSLGAILYELLCGVSPLAVGDTDLGDPTTIQRRILTMDPIRPSRRIGQLQDAEQVAECRRTRPRKLARQLRLDLDWIVLTALARDQEQRYATVSELIADLTRYLQGEPVQVGPPSFGYRLQKYVRRNRIPLAAITAVMLAMAAGLVASLTFAHQSELARQAAAEMALVAQREAQNAEMASDYLQSVLRLASPLRGGDPDLTLLEAVERIEGQLDAQLADSTAVNATTHVAIAEVHRSLGFYERGEAHAAQGVRTLRALPDTDSSQLAAALVENALNLQGQLKDAQAEPMYREALALYREIAADREPNRDQLVLNILTNLATIAGMTGSYREAADGNRDLIAHQEQTGAGSDVAIGRSLMVLGHFLAADARYAEGEEHLRRSITLMSDRYGEGHVNTGMAKYYLGSLYRKQGEHATALPLLSDATETFTKRLGDDHHYVLRAKRDLAAAWTGLGRYAAADSLFTDILERERRKGGDANQAVAITLLFQGDLYRLRGEPDRALERYREVERIARKRLPDADHFFMAMAMHQLALADSTRGDLASARHRLEACLAQRRRKLRPTHPRLIETVGDLARVTAKMEAFADARPLVAEYFVAAQAEYGPKHAETRRAAELYSRFCLATGATEQSRGWHDWLAGERETPPLTDRAPGFR